MLSSVHRQHVMQNVWGTNSNQENGGRKMLAQIDMNRVDWLQKMCNIVKRLSQVGASPLCVCVCCSVCCVCRMRVYFMNYIRIYCTSTWFSFSGASFEYMQSVTRTAGVHIFRMDRGGEPKDNVYTLKMCKKRSCFHAWNRICEWWPVLLLAISCRCHCWRPKSNDTWCMVVCAMAITSFIVIGLIW